MRSLTERNIQGSTFLRGQKNGWKKTLKKEFSLSAQRGAEKKQGCLHSGGESCPTRLCPSSLCFSERCQPISHSAHTRMYTDTCSHTYMCTHTRVHMYTHTCTYIHTYMSKYTHVHRHTRVVFKWPPTLVRGHSQNISRTRELQKALKDLYIVHFHLTLRDGQVKIHNVNIIQL